MQDWAISWLPNHPSLANELSNVTSAVYKIAVWPKAVCEVWPQVYAGADPSGGAIS